MYWSLKFTFPPWSVTVSIRIGTSGVRDALSEDARSGGTAAGPGFDAVLSRPASSFAMISWTLILPSGCTMIRE